MQKENIEELEMTNEEAMKLREEQIRAVVLADADEKANEAAESGVKFDRRQYVAEGLASVADKGKGAGAGVDTGWAIKYTPVDKWIKSNDVDPKDEKSVKTFISKLNASMGDDQAVLKKKIADFCKAGDVKAFFKKAISGFTFPFAMAGDVLNACRSICKNGSEETKAMFNEQVLENKVVSESRRYVKGFDAYFESKK